MSSAAMCKIGFGESGCRALRVPAPAIAFADPPIALLSLSPAPRDHHVLRSFLPTPRWIVRTAPRLSAARNLLRRGVIQVVLCDRDLRPGSWKQALNWLARLPRPPYLIVTSRIADEALQAEALNLGAHDVLAKPFDRAELIRVLLSAARHWRDCYAHP